MKSLLSAAFCLLTVLPVTFGLVELQTFFPYGPNAGDLRVPTADDNYVEVPLSGGSTYHFFNNTYDKLFVNNNGAISFVQANPGFTPNCGPSTVPMIMPYWADCNTLLGGNVYYRETTDSTLLQQATAEVHRSFPGIRNLALNWMFIATWDNVPFFGATENCNGLSLRNTFQTILVTDGTKSFAMFYFNNISWTTGTASGGTCDGQGGVPAKSGFDLGDGQTLFSLPGSCTSDVANVPSTSNVAQDGKWIFRIDESFSDAPVPEIPSTPEVIPDPETPSTPFPETPSTPEAIVGECDPSDCQHIGRCYEYSSCSHITRTWVTRLCSPGLYWNPPHRANNTDDECTASCDVWDNLPEETKTSYQADEKCFSECYYKATEECSGNYLFHSHKTDNRDVKLERCPVDTRLGMNVPLVWVQERETCDFCYNARNTNGNPCCERYDQVIAASTSTREPMTTPEDPWETIASERSTDETWETTATPGGRSTDGTWETTAGGRFAEVWETTAWPVDQSTVWPVDVNTAWPAINPTGTPVTVGSPLGSYPSASK